jgi:hypothetical protein
MDDKPAHKGYEENPVTKVTAKGLQKLINIFASLTPLDIQKVIAQRKPSK